MIKRRDRRIRETLRVESLETRALMTTVLGSSGNPQGMWPLANPSPSDTVLVRFQANATPSQVQAALNSVRGRVLQTFPDGPEEIIIGEGFNLTGAIDTLTANASVVYADPNATITASSVPVTPNDPIFSQQTGLNSANNVDIDAPQAWGISTGVPSTIVAVIDTGIDLNNADFAGKIWTNPVNDAASGYPNDVHGWNFISTDNDVQDNDGHGTHVSAIIAAQGNNGFGVAGVDWNAQIMPLKFLDANGNGTTDNAVAAIYFAVNHGARVINASWGGVGASQALQDAINYAAANNVVFVTAAGNDGTNNDVTPSYPSSYRASNELSVASVANDGSLPGFSNYGANTVDLAAPGVNIVSDVPTSIDPSGLQTLSGTSMSTAYVSGVAALVAGLNPGMSAAQIVQRIDTTTKPLPSLAGKTISGGMVDAYNAITDNGTTTGVATPVAGVPVLGAQDSTVAQVRSAIDSSDEFFQAHGGNATGFVTALYENLLDREPDSSGLSTWVGIYDSGVFSRYQIAFDIASSPEARLTEVAGWYQTDLGRTESIAGLKTDQGVAIWANLLLSGVGDNTVQGSIMSSAEYLIGHGATPPTVIDGLYQDLYDRTPDTTDQNAWAGLLWDGYAPFVVIRDFQGTPETEITQVASWFETDLNRSTSLADLKNDPGVQGWASRLGNF